MDLTKRPRKPAEELQAELRELVDRANDLADKFSGGANLDPKEDAEFSRLTGENGEIAKLSEEVNDAQDFERERDSLRRAKASGLYAHAPKFSGLGVWKDNDGSHSPQITVRDNRRGIIKDPRMAHLTGCYFTAVSSLPNADQALDDMNRLGWREYASQIEGTGSKGGYTVPEPIVREIIQHRDDVGVAMQVARVQPMDSETALLPEEVGRPTVYYPGEEGTITASDGSLAQHRLRCKKRGVLVRASSEVLADSQAAFGEWIIDASGHALAEKMDSELILGNATSTYGGVMGLIESIGSEGVNDADTGEDELHELDAEDWTDTIAKLPARYHRGAAWIMSRQVWNGSVLPILAAAGGSGWAALMAGANGDRPNWFGYPVFFSEQMPAAAASTIVALLGDFTKAVTIGDRGDMRIDTSIHEQFEKDMVSFRLLHRYDVLVTHPGDSSEAGAYVALKTAA